MLDLITFARISEATMDLSHIKHRIKQRRKALGFTQEELAERVGVSPTAVTDWETGKSRPWESLALLSKVLQVSIDWLVTGENISEIEFKVNPQTQRLQGLELKVATLPEKQRELILEMIDQFLETPEKGRKEYRKSKKTG